MEGQHVRNHPFENGQKGAYPLYSLYALGMLDNNLALPIVVDSNDSWLEFGVYTGASVNITGHIHRNTPLSIFGLDTFTGLPQEWKGHHPKGQFSLMGNLPPVKVNVNFLEGLFSEQLPTILTKETRVVGMNLDCDLFQGTIDALEGTYPYWEVGILIHFHELQQSPNSKETRFALQEEAMALHKFMFEHPGIMLEMISITNDYSETVIFRVIQMRRT
jgi:hypothetical protein